MGQLKPNVNPGCMSVIRSRQEFKMAYMHYHYSYEIYYLEKGSKNYFVEDKFFTLKEGDFVLIPPGSIHKTGGESATRILIDLKEEYFSKFFSPISTLSLKKAFEKTLVRPPEELQSSFKKMLSNALKEYDQPEYGDCYFYIAQILTELKKCNEVPPNDYGCNTKIQHILEYLGKNYKTIDDIDEVATNVYITKYHLCHLFKKEMGISLVSYLNQLKLKHACDLLQNSDKSITEICSECGFNSSTYFSIIFKKNIGMSPSEFRKKYA